MSPLANPLDPNEARLFGVLIEKSLTTPDQYPLSINGATSGANQKSNRDPVMSLSEGEVNDALARLIIAGLAGRVVPAGSRVEKYRHNGQELLGLEPTKLAILAELMMRGPQTKGELRQRVNRMKPVPDLEALQVHLVVLEKDGWIRPVPPAPGSRAGRFAQTLSPDSHPVEASAAAAPTPMSAAPGSAPSTPPAPSPAPGLEQRVNELESEVSELKRQLQGLAEKLGETL